MLSDVIKGSGNISIWGVIEGPFSSQDIPDWEYEEDGWMVVCTVENSYGGLEVEEVVFGSFDEAYEIVNYFKHGRMPFIMEVQDD